MSAERRRRPSHGGFGEDGQAPWPAPPLQLPPLGARISFRVNREDLVGIVGFAGETLFAPGTWVGIVLDTPTGKNDGTVKGKRYFECPPDHGLFIRPTNVHAILEPPRSHTSVETTSEDFAKAAASFKRSGPVSAGTSPPRASLGKAAADVVAKADAAAGELDGRQSDATRGLPGGPYSTSICSESTGATSADSDGSSQGAERAQGCTGGLDEVPRERFREEVAMETAALEASMRDEQRACAEARQAEASMADSCRAEQAQAQAQASEAAASTERLRHELAAAQVARLAAEREASSLAEAAGRAKASRFFEAEEQESQTATLKRQLKAAEAACDSLTNALGREQACEAREHRKAEESREELVAWRRGPQVPALFPAPRMESGDPEAEVLSRRLAELEKRADLHDRERVELAARLEATESQAELPEMRPSPEPRRDALTAPSAELVLSTPALSAHSAVSTALEEERRLFGMLAQDVTHLRARASPASRDLPRQGQRQTLYQQWFGNFCCARVRPPSPVHRAP